MLTEEIKKKRVNRISPDWLSLLSTSTGLQGGSDCISSWLRGESDSLDGRREVRGQARPEAQSHPANTAPKRPRHGGSGEVAGRPLQSRPWRNAHGAVEHKRTQEEPVVATVGATGLYSPSASPLPPPVYRAHITWIHFTLALFKKKEKISRSLFKKDRWILPTPLQSLWPHGHSPSQLLPSCLCWTRRKKRGTMLPLRRYHCIYVWPRMLYSSALQNSRRGLNLLFVI